MNSRLKFIAEQIRSRHCPSLKNPDSESPDSPKLNAAVWDIGGDHGQLGVDLIKKGLTEYRLIDPQRELSLRLEQSFWKKLGSDRHKQDLQIKIIQQRAQDYFATQNNPSSRCEIVAEKQVHLVICGMGAENIINILASWNKHCSDLPYTAWLGPNSYPHRLENWLSEPFQTHVFHDGPKERLLFVVESETKQ